MKSKNVRISRGTARKLIKLLHMKYKPNELAEIMGVSVDTIYRSYIPAGAPHEKDGKGNVWIVGTAFAQWAMDCAVTNDRKPEKIKMTAGQVFCMRCNRVVNITNPKKGSVNSRGVLNVSGRCSQCEGKVNRFVRASELQ